MPDPSKSWVRRRDAEAGRSAAAGVGLAAVVRLAATGAQLASNFLRHAPRVPAVRRPTRIRFVVTADGWTSSPFTVAASGWARLRGVDTGGAIALWTRSVHTFGLARPIGVVEIDGGGMVLGTGVLRPDRLLTRRAPRWFLELPARHPLPPSGIRLTPRRLPPGDRRLETGD